MRPTFSIILFTVVSGAGYGLLFLIGLAIAFGTLPSSWLLPVGLEHLALRTPVVTSAAAAVAVALVVGTGLATIGLLASVTHLGKPLRAWRALSQWRSSWLSREGIASLVTNAPIVALLAMLSTRDPLLLTVSVRWRICGGLLCVCCAATIYCTASIYACLKPIRAWHDRHVRAAYLYLGMYSGGLCATALSTLGVPSEDKVVAIWIGTAFVLGPCAALVKRSYWRSIDAAVPTSAGHATGLDRFGNVQRFEQPHTEENYLTHEMGFVVARKHARKLRAIAFWSILLAPLATLPLGWLFGWPAAWLALAVGMTGVFVERWLFFAEARHAVMAYYDR